MALAFVTVLFLVAGVALALLAAGYVYAGRDVPAGVDWAGSACILASVVAHVVAQVGGPIRDDFLLASPFLLLGAGGLVLLTQQRQRKHRHLPRRTVLLPTALLVVALALTVKGVAGAEGGPTTAPPAQTAAQTAT